MSLRSRSGASAGASVDGRRRVNLRVGTRASKLARAQTGMVIGLLRTSNPADTFEEVVVATDDDAVGDKSRFTSALERALVDDQIDIAVHSAKDLPGQIGDGLAIAGVPERAATHDVICGVGGLDELAPGARVGTSSLRRRAQLLAQRPDLRVEPLRGNIDTRLAKLAAGEYDAIALAQAGLRRLGVNDVIAGALDRFVPAPGQGTLVLQARADDQNAAPAARSVSHGDSERALDAERTAMAVLGADCDTPVGVLATRSYDGGMLVDGWLGAPDGSVWVRDQVTGSALRAAELGHQLAERMLSAGGREILEAARRAA